MIDDKLRATTKALQSWSMRNIGSEGAQLFMARVHHCIVGCGLGQRPLTDEEVPLRKDLKFWSLGLASLARTIERQRSQVRFLQEGDANTRFLQEEPYSLAVS